MPEAIDGLWTARWRRGTATWMSWPARKSFTAPGGGGVWGRPIQHKARNEGNGNTVNSEDSSLIQMTGLRRQMAARASLHQQSCLQRLPHCQRAPWMPEKISTMALAVLG